MKLPWTCNACGQQNYHYGNCNCPDGQLARVVAERTQIKRRLKELKALEVKLRAANETK